MMQYVLLTTKKVSDQNNHKIATKENKKK